LASLELEVNSPSQLLEEIDKMENNSPKEEGPVDNFKDLLNDSPLNDQSKIEPTVGKQVVKTMVSQTHKNSSHKGSSSQKKTLPLEDISTHNEKYLQLQVNKLQKK